MQQEACPHILPSSPVPFSCVRLGARGVGGVGREEVQEPHTWTPAKAAISLVLSRALGPRFCLVSYPHLFSNLDILKLHYLHVLYLQIYLPLKRTCNPQIHTHRAQGSEELAPPMPAPC